MKVEIKKIKTYSIWKWGIDDEEVCGICRMPYEACCPSAKYPGDDCPPIWGKCGHAFHMQCVFKWLESQDSTKQVCPMCRQQWALKES